MKMTRGIVFIFSVFLLTLIYACETDQVDIQTEVIGTKQLQSSEVFDDVLIMTQEAYERIVDYDIVLEFSKKSDLSQDESRLLAEAMGYRSLEDFEAFNLSLKEKLNTLESEFNIGALSQEDLESLIEEKNQEKFGGDPCNCFGMAQNCLNSVTAAAVIAHLGCTTLDLTIVGGILCHAAVLVVQHSESNNCFNNRNHCLQQCNSL
jgi:hypothetical protein